MGSSSSDDLLSHMLNKLQWPSCTLQGGVENISGTWDDHIWPSCGPHDSLSQSICVYWNHMPMSINLSPIHLSSSICPHPKHLSIPKSSSHQFVYHSIHYVIYTKSENIKSYSDIQINGIKLLLSRTEMSLIFPCLMSH